MLREKDDLLCDMAEYYHIYDLEGLPVNKLAALSYGLPPQSRSKMRLAGFKVPMDTLLLALAADRLGMLVWLNSEDGKKCRNRPKLITPELIGTNKEKKDDVLTFRSGEDFEKARNELLKKGEKI